MFIFIVVVSLVVGYSVLVFGIAPFVVPHMRQIEYQALPEDLQKIVRDMTTISADTTEVVERIFYAVTDHFSAARNLQFTNPSKLFLISAKDIWYQGGTQSCTVLNFILANALYATGKFTKNQISIRTTYIGINIHQYVEITFDETSLALDPWGYYYNIPFGKYACGILPWRIGGTNH